MSTVLIVDDDVVSRVLLRHVLSKAGHSVIEAESGAEGLVKYDTCSIDLIISDQMMHEMSGLEFRQQLGPELAVPFVLLTGYVNEDEFDGTTELFDAYITKPVASSTVVELLHQLLATSATRH